MRGSQWVPEGPGSPFKRGRTDLFARQDDISNDGVGDDSGTGAAHVAISGGAETIVVGAGMTGVGGGGG